MLLTRAGRSVNGLAAAKPIPSIDNTMKHKRGYVKNCLQEAERLGLTYAEASERYQITRATVYALCQRYQVNLKRTDWGYYTGKKKVKEASPSESNPSP